MNAHRIALRLPAADPAGVDPVAAVPVFHKWIQRQALPGHLLIDVADYLHVPDGPGVVLIAHEANLGLDQAPLGPGLAYQRNRPFGTTFADRLATVLASTLEAAVLLQSDLPGLTFRTDRLVLRIVDKLNAPNDDTTLDRIRPDLEKVFRSVYGPDVTFARDTADPRSHFQLTVTAPPAPGLMDLFERATIPGGAGVGAP